MHTISKPQKKSDNEKILKDIKRGVETRLKQENV